MIYIISILISFFIVGQYVQGKQTLALKSLFLCAISFFEPNLDAIGLDYITIRAICQNAYFLSIVLILLYNLTKNRKRENKDYGVKIIVLLLFSYAIFEALFTLLSGKESIVNVFALLKPYVFILSVFIVTRMTKDACVSALWFVYKITLVMGVIAIAQVVLGFEMFGRIVLDYNEGIDRFWSPYHTATLCLFMCLIFPPKKWSVAYFFFFLVIVFLPLRRGIIVAASLTLAIYYLYQLAHGKINKSVVGVILVVLLSFPLLLNRFTSEGDSVSDDFTSIFSGQVDYSNFRAGGGGSTGFRLAILLERVDYMVSNPQYLLTGVGFIHEDTAQKQFNFYLGSRKSVHGEVSFMQIDNGDIVWPPILMRVGLIGLVLYLVFFFKLLFFFVHNIKHSQWALVGAMFLFSFLLFSIADSQLVEPYSYLLYFIIYRIVCVEKDKSRLLAKME